MAIRLISVNSYYNELDQCRVISFVLREKNNPLSNIIEWCEWTEPGKEAPCKILVNETTAYKVFYSKTEASTYINKLFKDMGLTFTFNKE